MMPDLARARDAIASRGCRLGAPLTIEDETRSTNDDAKEGAKGGAPHGATWLAEAQTAGRGRQGRVWVSPRGENLLFSVLLRLRCAPARVPQVSLACGLAVRDVVARLLPDAKVMVKWPNDVVIERDGALRKIAGILVESALAGGKVEHVVCGIGLNVHTRALPEELASIATSLAIEGAIALDRAEILADVLAALDRDVEHVAHKGLGLLHARLSAADALAGRSVETDGGERGTACGVDPDGRLMIRGADGSVARVSSGEVRVRLA
ncbi:MAG: biotin--[acetyl-CoA-carboxylase] ligase [Labilithrix sp.]|nr:biotin--[acetyl-CoA-carboxylase] ligase [Labilithrix sp.]